MADAVRLQRFVTLYEANLRAAIERHPDQYRYGVDRVPVVVERMTKAFVERSYNKDGFAIKWTCRELGIVHTYTAINHYLAGS